MEKLQYEDERPSTPKQISSNREILENILKLSAKIDALTEKVTELELKIDTLNVAQIRMPISKNDVEIEERIDFEENYLTPNEIYAENPAIQTTLIKLIDFRIATASEIARITNKERAVESFYLNDLWNRNKIRKLRIGRNIYFYVGKSNEIMPFKNPIIKPDWRFALVSIIRGLVTFETSKKIKFEKILKNYIECVQPEVSSGNQPNSEKEKEKLFQETLAEYETELLNILKDIEKNTSFLKLIEENKKIEFVAAEWLRLA